MTTNTILEDTTLAALISSKICHDLAGPIGAINNGLELLEEESDEDTRYYALELIHNSAKAAWAQLDFNRLAFGVASGLGAVVPLAHVERVARRHIERGKHRLHRQSDVEDLPKEFAKLLLAALAIAVTALPAGGDLYLQISGEKQKNQSAKKLKLVIRCQGRSARVPEGVADILAGKDFGPIDTKLIVPYYARRLAAQGAFGISAAKEGDDVMITLTAG